MRPRVSILLSTRNRASSLRATLATVARVVIPGDLPTELVVVDNGSTDNTSAVVDDAGIDNMPVRRVHIEQPGKCLAVNRAIGTCSADILLYTDDDVRVPTNWVECMCRPIASGQADAVAGSIIADPLRRLAVDGTHVAHWFQWDFTQIRSPGVMIGASMASRRSVWATVGGFDEELGPGRLGFGDDVLFSWQIQAAGFRIVSAHSCIVEHHFELHRLEPEALRKRAWQEGRVWAHQYYHWLHGKPRFAAAKQMALRCARPIGVVMSLMSTNARIGCSAFELSLIAKHSFHRHLRTICGESPKYNPRAG